MNDQFKSLVSKYELICEDVGSLPPDTSTPPDSQNAPVISTENENEPTDNNSPGSKERYLQILELAKEEIKSCLQKKTTNTDHDLDICVSEFLAVLREDLVDELI